MQKRPSISDQNIGVFFGGGAKKDSGVGERKEEKPEPQNTRTPEQKLRRGNQHLHRTFQDLVDISVANMSI